MEGPCWPIPDVTDLDCCSFPDDTSGPVLEDLIERMAPIAASVLWDRSGRMYGACPVQVRPCRDKCSNGCLCPSSGCCCSQPCRVSLYGSTGGRPLDSIVSVMVDGEELPSTSYAILDPFDLVRLDGECWPRCPDLSLEGDEWSVTVQPGIPLDAAALAAYHSYVCELVKACIPGCQCRLPRNVISTVRQGVNQRFPSPAEIMVNGMTGLHEVDEWLSSVNPDRHRSPSQVFSPDMPEVLVLR